MIIQDKITRIISTSEFGFPIYHRAICFDYEGETYILHQTFSGPELTTLTRYNRKRQILNTKQYDLKKEIDTDKLLDLPEYQTFGLLNHNCENYVNDIIDRYTTTQHTHLSQQVTIWIIIIIIFLIYIHH